jgi:hypothetical protein
MVCKKFFVNRVRIPKVCLQQKESDTNKEGLAKEHTFFAFLRIKTNTHVYVRTFFEAEYIHIDGGFQATS